MAAEKLVPIRNTNQRQLIFEYLEHTLTHPTAEQIFQNMRQELPRISFGTVYRNLDILEKQGLISTVIYSKEHVRYQVGSMNHSHFVCSNCDKVKNVVIDDLTDLNNQVSRRHKVMVQKYNLIFYGQCANCQKM
ncbi:MAG: Ferric uptake regulator, Fur family [Parcubacteria group bacterium GW2011_GWC2_39_14]|nr:MAG: Ferric uptake regulator, Fur family [Parcubacteria group bacterium GW2011_GWC2_39_14]KKR55166.1 MAG: Ferric uptake regulator, Fur family [Parcubacteria group bacterium GW2011_GWA2_40_23]